MFGHVGFDGKATMRVWLESWNARLRGAGVKGREG